MEFNKTKLNYTLSSLYSMIKIFKISTLQYHEHQQTFDSNLPHSNDGSLSRNLYSMISTYFLVFSTITDDKTAKNIHTASKYFSRACDTDYIQKDMHTKHVRKSERKNAKIKDLRYQQEFTDNIKSCLKALPFTRHHI